MKINKIMKQLLLLVSILCVQAVFSQQEDAWVYFTGKPDMAYYLNNPLEMLSQRSLDRRTAQGIVPDEKDVPVYPQYISLIEQAAGITVMAKSKWLNALHIRGTQGNIAALAGFPFVQRIDYANKNIADIQARPSAANQQEIASKILETAVEFPYGNSSNQIQMLNGHLLHQQDYTGAGKVIAVLDSGFPGVNTAQPFQRLYDNNLILGGYNFVARSDDFYTGNNHGTLVLSTMGGYVENQLVGTAPDAAYYLFITEDVSDENPVEESLWVEAAEMADSLGADVINTSLGYFLYNDPDYSYTYSDMDGQTAFITRGSNIAFTRGMICVTSAGNSGNTVNPNITAPADAFNTLTVGAVNASGTIAGFSSSGPSFDQRIKPDVVAQGVASVLANPAGNIVTANGTSFSGPITTGLVASLWQALPDKTNAEIIQLVKQSADRYNNPDFQYGYGIPDFNQALQLALGLEEPQNQNLQLYPNPTTGIINLTFPEGVENATLTVFNNLGQLMVQQSIFKDVPSFSVEGFVPGIYLYRLESAGQVKSGKLIKQ